MTDKAPLPATVEELEAALAAALANRRQTDEQRRDAQTAAWQALTSDPASWEWRATPQKPWSRDDPQSALRIECRIRPELLEAWQAKGPGRLSVGSQTGRWLGMSYYRTEEGILMHFGGGRQVLATPCLCSDEQWAELAEGKVPARWKLSARFA